ncbi:MAG: di-trans,poly-cis-decaprenylcistransferase [Clostridia bacterium]|nr:di-trans,poly-cis-decaprenylcistransferase [Clostridia bacterium]
MAQTQTENPIRVDARLRHIAFIMDGNGRWAQKRMMPREYGHKVGAATFKKVVRHCGDIGIKTVTVYAFSTENWSRPPREVNAILRLLEEYLDKCENDREAQDIRYRFIGDQSVLPEGLRRRIEHIERTSADRELTLNIALNYGARDELVHAVNRLIAEGKQSVTAEDISGALYTADSPDPDLIVRTGGELRLSNFLLWQAAYAELYFTDVLWPDLSDQDVDAAVRHFYARQRRFGGV